MLLQIGAALPLTGPLAQIGRMWPRPRRGALRRLNEQGGVYGRHIELIVEDSRGVCTDGAGSSRLPGRDPPGLALWGALSRLRGRTPGAPGAGSCAVDFPLTQSLSCRIRPTLPYFMPCLVRPSIPVVDGFFCVLNEGPHGDITPRLALARMERGKRLRRCGALEQFGIMANLAMNYEYSTGRQDVVALVTQRNSRNRCRVVLGDGEDLVSMAQELARRRGISPIVLSAIGMGGAHARTVPVRPSFTECLATPIDPPTERR